MTSLRIFLVGIALILLVRPVLAVPFQVVPFVVVGGPESGIHFRTKLIFAGPGVGFVGAGIGLSDDNGNPIPAVFDGQGPVTSFVSGSPEVVISHPTSEVQLLRASIGGIDANVVVRVIVQMFDGARLLTEIEQEAVVPPILASLRKRGTETAALRGAVVALDTRGGKDLGLVVMNPTISEARVKFMLKPFVGAPSSLESQEFVLGPRKRLIGMVGEFFKGTDIKDRSGAIEIRGDRTILVVPVEINWPNMRALPVFPLILANEVFVGPQGNDAAGDGSPERPFRTITRALKLTKGLLVDHVWLPIGPVVVKASGKFSAAEGESFPLILESGTGDSQWLALEGPTIEGGGDFEGTNAAVVIRRGPVSLRWSSITNPNPGGAGVLLKSGRVTLEECQIRGSTTGILALGHAEDSFDRAVSLLTTTLANNQTGVKLQGRARLHARRSSFFGNETAIEFRDQSSGDLRDNALIANKVGVAVFNEAKPNFGDDELNRGRNFFKGNVDADLCHHGAEAISAKNNIWDNTPPSRSSTCVGGVDIGGTGTEKVAHQ